jgi:cytosine permease
VNFWSKWFKGPSNTSKSEHVEDYAIRKIPSHFRWPIPSIILVLLGNSSAMFLFTFGVKLSYMVGWPFMLSPLLYFFVGSTIIGTLMIRLASKEGLTIDLMTRGMGFGFMGSALTSFIYGINYIFYFLFEGTIVTHAISLYLGINFNSTEGTLIFALVGLLKLWFVWYGMRALQILQTWGIAIYSVLLGICLFMLIKHYDILGPTHWFHHSPLTSDTIWTAFMMVNGQIVFQGLMATDYGRFARENAGYKGGFLCMVGMMVPMLVNILIGPLFAYTIMPKMDGTNIALMASDSGFVYPTVMGIWGVLFVIVTQIRINVMNLYSGSLALSNTFSLAFRFTPGRQWWMVLVYALGCIFYASNIIQYLNTWLAITGILTNTWIFIILTDQFICRKWLKLGPADFIEYRRPYLYKWNPTGLFSLTVSVVFGSLGVFGYYPLYYSSFLTMVIGPILHVGLTIITGGRFYFTDFPLDRETEWLSSGHCKGEKALSDFDFYNKESNTDPKSIS